MRRLAWPYQVLPQPQQPGRLMALCPLHQRRQVAFSLIYYPEKNYHLTCNNSDTAFAALLLAPIANEEDKPEKERLI